jgi:hypothetical protein
VGEELGDPLASEERSDEALLIDTSWTKKHSGQWLNLELRWPMCHHQSNAGSQGEPARDGDEQGRLTSISVNSLGQNSISSSRSKDRLASNCDRKAVMVGDSTDNSRIDLMPRNCFCEFCDTDTRGALLFRPPW